jgi:hypothetical protein
MCYTGEEITVIVVFALGRYGRGSEFHLRRDEARGWPIGRKRCWYK